MATILFAWEYGGNLGHVAALTPIADVMAERGHRCVFVMRDQRAAYKLWGGPRFPVLAAPAPPVNVLVPPMMGTYAEVLYADGWADLVTVAARAQSWRDLLDLVKPDLVIADYSPAVTMFAPSTVRTMAVGFSFAVPPAAPQLPNFRTWMPADRDRMEKIEQRVRDVVSVVRQSFGLPHTDSLGEMAQPRHNILLSLPELDCYSARDDVQYLPPPISACDKAPISWPSNATTDSTATAPTKVFAYLYGDNPHTERFVNACGRLPCSVLAVLTNAPKSLVDNAPPNVTISIQPVDPIVALDGADVVVLHGGTMAVSALVRGKPVLLFPTQAEQMTTSIKVQNCGAGLLVQDVTGKPDFLGALRKLIADPKYTIAAKALKEKYAHLDDTNTAKAVADRAELLLSAAP
jgi:UDP:flavonoid glycosyltransferase YjiC (YdhE family)